MPELAHLPSRLDGPEGLIALADLFGEAEVFELIMLCRTSGTVERDAGGAALTVLGNRLVGKVKAQHPEYDDTQARRAAAGLVGFLDSGSRANFYNILKGGRRLVRKKR